MLFLFMVNSLVFCIAYAIFQAEHFAFYHYFDQFFLSTMLLFHPAFYFYIKSLEQKSISKKILITHSLPAIIAFISSVTLLTQLSQSEAITYFTENLFGKPSDLKVVKVLSVVDKGSKYTHVIQAVFYFFLVHRILLRNKKELNNMFSYGDSYKLNWLFKFNFVYSIGTLSGVLVVIIPEELLKVDNLFMDTSMILLALFSLFIGIKGAEQKSWGSEIVKLDEQLKEVDSADPVSINLELKVTRYIETDKAFLNPELKIWDVVRNTRINRSYVSQYINKKTGLNFNQYVNKLRVDEVCCKVKLNRNETLESIALSCGFNSMPTFSRAFKQFVGKTPSEYYNEQNNVKEFEEQRM